CLLPGWSAGSYPASIVGPLLPGRARSRHYDTDAAIDAYITRPSPFAEAGAMTVTISPTIQPRISECRVQSDNILRRRPNIAYHSSGSIARIMLICFSVNDREVRIARREQHRLRSLRLRACGDWRHRKYPS